MSCFSPRHSKPLCQDLSDIVSEGTCPGLGDQLYECRELIRVPVKYRPGYGQCILDNNIDMFKVGAFKNIKERKKKLNTSFALKNACA